MCCVVLATTHLRGAVTDEHGTLAEWRLVGEYQGYSEKNFLQCHFFHLEPQMKLHGTEPEASSTEASI
jgi:hypothetical protein